MWKKSRKCGALSDFIITAVMGHSWHKILYEHTKCFNYRTVFIDHAQQKKDKKDHRQMLKRVVKSFLVSISLLNFLIYKHRRGQQTRWYQKGRPYHVKSFLFVFTDVETHTLIQFLIEWNDKEKITPGYAWFSAKQSKQLFTCYTVIKCLSRWKHCLLIEDKSNQI